MGAGSNPPGDHREPWLVVILSFVTFGIYYWYWMWVTTQEADRFDPQHDSAHTHAKWAILAGIGGYVLYAVGAIMLFASAGAADAATNPEQFLAAAGASFIFVMLGGLALLAATVGVLIALWRLWQQIEFHERALNHDALAAGTMMGILIGGVVVGALLSFLVIGIFVILGVYGYILHRTQTGLNRMWAAAQQGYTPPAKPTPGYGGGPPPSQQPSQQPSQPTGTGGTGSGSQEPQGPAGTEDR